MGRRAGICYADVSAGTLRATDVEGDDLAEAVNDELSSVKPTEAVRPMLRSVELRPPYDGAKDYFLITDVDDRDYLAALVTATCKALPDPKPKIKKKS